MFVLAGFIAQAERWAEFSEAWQRHLTTAPKIRYLKMAEAAKLNGQFRFWKPKARDEKLAGCVEILKTFAQRAIHVTIDLPAFETRMAPNLLKSMSSAYFMGCYSILAGICYDILDTGASQCVEVIFDEHLIFAPRVSVWYPVIKEAIETRTPELRGILPLGPMFKDDEQYLPLQASDVLAWMFRMAFSGLRNEFEWIASELSPVIPMSSYSSIFVGERMDRIYAKSLDVQFSPELVRKWRSIPGLSGAHKGKLKKR